MRGLREANAILDDVIRSNDEVAQTILRIALITGAVTESGKYTVIELLRAIESKAREADPERAAQVRRR